MNDVHALAAPPVIVHVTVPVGAVPVPVTVAINVIGTPTVVVKPGVTLTKMLGVLCPRVTVIGVEFTDT